MMVKDRVDTSNFGQDFAKKRMVNHQEALMKSVFKNQEERFVDRVVQNPGYIDVDRSFFLPLCRCWDSRAARLVTSPSTFTPAASACTGAPPSTWTAACCCTGTTSVSGMGLGTRILSRTS